MFIAIDNKQQRIHIDDAVIRQEYFCPYCESALIMRKGNVRKHHFSHKPSAVCKDTWQSEYDMSDWHSEWQNCYPKDNQEIRCQLGEIIHRADVMVDRTVIEFQHSSLSAKKFFERTSFYRDLGFKVIWVFDLSDLFEKGSIILNSINGSLNFTWIRPRNTFQETDILSGHTGVFFQLNADGEKCLIRVDEISSFGMELFSADRWYSKEQFLSYTGLVNGICALPYHEDEVINEQYNAFCKQYAIHLNKQQERAVQAINGSNLLLAVPGSGKTTVMVVRLGYMVLCRGIDPASIVSITYTKTAVSDMKTRFAKFFGGELADKMVFKTINGLCHEIIEYYKGQKSSKGFKLKEESDCRKILREIYQRTTEEYPNENDIILIQSAISCIKNRMLNIDEILDFETEIPNIVQYYKEYISEMKKRNFMDYDDQIIYAKNIFLHFHDILEYFQNKYNYVCVDEAQDTSKLQHFLIKQLVKKYANIFMVGDEDQSIYGFRGAYPQALMDFRNDYPNPFILYMERNYRSTPEIVSAAQKFIEKNKNRHPKKMTAERRSGKNVTKLSVKNRREQYTFLINIVRQPHGEIAILYRDNECAVPLLDMCLRQGLPFFTPLKRNIFFSSRQVLDIICFLRLVIDPYDVDSFMQIYYKCGLGFNKKTAVFAYNRCRKYKCSVTEALIHNLSKWSKLETKARKFTAYLQNAANMSSEQAIDHIYQNMYNRYMKENHMDYGKIEILETLASHELDIRSFLKRVEELPKLIEQNSRRTENAVVLSTFHSAKGQEYDTVYVMDIFDGTMPNTSENEIHDPSRFKDSYQEERRLFYVGLTRAKKELYLLDIESNKSSFIDELFPKPQCPNNNSNNTFVIIPSASIPVCMKKKAMNNSEQQQVDHIGSSELIDTEETQGHFEEGTTNVNKESSAKKRTDPQEEIRSIHETTGKYVGNKIKGEYVTFSLEEITSKTYPNILVDYSRENFVKEIKGVCEFSASAVKNLFIKFLYITPLELAEFMPLYNELRQTSPNTAQDIEFLMEKAGIDHDNLH